jgi:hypothetical protein
MPQTHVLKCWSLYWDQIARGEKTFEVRFADRPYVVGDILELHRIEQDAANSEPPAPLLRRVTSVLPGGLEFHGYHLIDPRAVVMSIGPVTVPAQSPEAQMIEHLRETLASIRDQLAVEFTVGEPVRQKMLSHLINLIDETLE